MRFFVLNIIYFKQFQKYYQIVLDLELTPSDTLSSVQIFMKYKEAYI